MPDLAAPETTRSDALVSVPAGRAAPGAEQQGEQERERPGGRSPRAAPAAMAAELANEPGAAMPSLVARLQREYGNAYTREVVSRVRGRGGAGRPAEAPAVQRKAVIGAAGDSFEREADAVAQSVTSGGAVPAISPVDGGVARIAAYEQPRTEEQRRKKVPPAPVQRAATVAPTGAMEAAATEAIASPGAGSPLEAGTRAVLEARMQTDLGDVRVHDDATAQRQATAAGARAFTHGSDIWLGPGESQQDLSLMAHEATHVVQQRGGDSVQRKPAHSLVQRLIPDFILEEINDYARHIPGWTLFTVIIGFNPLTRQDVPRSGMNLLQGFMGLVPFGTMIFDALLAHGVIERAATWVEGELGRLDLSLDRIERTIEAAWDDVSLIEGFDYNLNVLRRHVGRLYDDVVAFAESLVNQILALIKEAVIGAAERLLADNRAWALIKKVLNHDPLRDVPVTATPTEILEDFLRLIGKEQHLETMREQGTVEETANWLVTQIVTFTTLLGELGGLFVRAWEAIQPQNLPALADNVRALATDVGGFLQRVWDFAVTVAVKVLELIKKALLSWLASVADDTPGFHLVTVILGRNPFTGQDVPRTAQNIIRGFITLLPRGNEIYAKLEETGAVEGAAGRIEGAMASLGITWDAIVSLFTGLWNSFSIDDLLRPVEAFGRIVETFGAPIMRLFAFVGVVLREFIFLVLQMMNFPFDLIGSIVSNAMAAIEDIKRDPIAFLLNMLSAVKLGFTGFFDKIGTYLLGGLADWLFRGLRSAGIEPPQDLTFQSVLDFVLNVLGISIDRIWEKLADRIGQENVDRIRGAIDKLAGVWTFVRDVQERGVVAIWEYIEGQLSNLWGMVLQKAQDWVMERIIQRAIQWMLGLLDITGIMPVINSFVAFFHAVQSAIEYMRDILAIVNDYVTTLAAVARGEIQPGAAKMELGLANAIPVAIGFLANQFGLGNIGEKISEIVGGLRAMVDAALDWLIDQAVSGVQSMLAALGFGGGKEEGAAPVEGDVVPVHEDFDVGAAGEDHTISNREGTNVLVMQSDPTVLDQHPSEDVRDAYAKYLADIAAATSPTAKREAANANLRIIVAKIKAAGDAAAPGASAPGIGTVDRHKNQQSKMRQSGVPVWFTESEHVIPRSFIDTAFAALAQQGIPMGSADYREMHTILIYKGAANLKTHGPFGDASRINDFKNAIGETMEEVFRTRRSGLTRALGESHRASMSLLDAFGEEAIDRTLDAIKGENTENAAARGPAGEPEPLRPSESAVISAATLQQADLNAQLEARINAFLERRAAGSP